MSKKNKTILLLTSIALLLLVQISSVFAYATWGGNHRLTNGVHNRYTWYDSTTIDTNLHNNIVFARDDWNNTPTHVWFIETTYKPNSVIDIYHGPFYDPGLGILAKTLFYVGNTEINPWDQDYGWTRIYLNSPAFDSLSTYHWSGIGYVNQKKGVIAHEMGHVFGLAHVGSITALMYNFGDTCQVDAATQDEINGVNFLYP